MQFFSFALLALAIVGVVAFAREPLASVLWRVGAPFSYFRDAILGGTGEYASSFASNRSLYVENNRLRQALASSSVALQDRALLYRENLDLKSRLNRAPANMRTTVASVLLRPPMSPYDTLLIDVGKNAGIEKGDLVAAGGSVYIGKVGEVYATTARVILFSAPGETYDALLLDKAATSTLAISVAGQGGGSLTAEVPAGTFAAIGDIVAFPSIMPQLVAEVVYMEADTQASFKTIYMHLPVSMSSLSSVEVRHPLTNHVAQ